MKRSISLILLLIIAVYLSGCGGISIKNNLERTDVLKVSYPSVANINNKAIRDNINAMLYLKAFEFLNENSILKSKADYSSIYDVSYKKRGIVSIRFMETFILPWNNETQSRMKSITFNIKNGTVYSLDELFLPGTAYKDILDKLMKEVIKNNGMLLMSEFKGLEKDQGFYLTNDGLVLYYQTGVYTPVRLGPLSIVIKYPKIKGYLRKDLDL